MAVSIPSEIHSTSLRQAILQLAAYFGKDVTDDFLLDALPESENKPILSIVKQVLHHEGIKLEIANSISFHELKAPCCLKLNNGLYATLLQIVGDDFYFAQEKYSDGGLKIDRHQIEEYFAGEALMASETIETVEHRLIKIENKGHWFWREVRSQKPLFYDAVLGSLCANLLAACISLFTLQVYDRVIPHQSTATLWVLVAGVALAIILEASLRISRAHLLDASGRHIEIRLYRFLFDKFINSRSGKSELSPGAKVHALREFNSLREFFTTASIGSVADIPFSVIFLGLIYMIAGNVAFVILFAMIAIIVPSLFAQKKIAKLSEEMLSSASVSNKILIETAYGQDTIKTCRAENHYKKQWNDIVQLTSEKTAYQRVLTAGLAHSAQAIQQSSYIIAIVVGVFLVFAGDFTVGSIIAISILSTRTLAPITQLSNIVTRWQQVKASLSSLEAIVNSEQDRPEDRDYLRHERFDGAIELKDIQFQYGEKAPALSIKTLKIQQNEKIAILGTNGSGKSTLLKILSGLNDFTNGSISYDGLDIRQIDPTDIRNQIGYLPQEVKLFAGTLKDNLVFGSVAWSEQQIVEAIEFSGLANLIKQDPRGLDLMIEDGGTGLSLGQRQCVGLARLFLQDPKIILLDEPTASLDQALERRLIESLETWLTHRTCILTTHRIELLSLVDRIVVLQNGQLLLDDEKEEAIKKISVQNNKQQKRQEHAQKIRA